MEHGACLKTEAPHCLRDVPDGTRARVLALRGGARVRSRLCSLGFTPGTWITVYDRGPCGCRVQVRDACVVLDCEVAGNIVCEFSSGGSTAAEGSLCPCRPGAGSAPAPQCGHKKEA